MAPPEKPDDKPNRATPDSVENADFGDFISLLSEERNARSCSPPPETGDKKPPDQINKTGDQTDNTPKINDAERQQLQNGAVKLLDRLLESPDAVKEIKKLFEQLKYMKSVKIDKGDGKLLIQIENNTEQYIGEPQKKMGIKTGRMRIDENVSLSITPTKSALIISDLSGFSTTKKVGMRPEGEVTPERIIIDANGNMQVDISYERFALIAPRRRQHRSDGHKSLNLSAEDLQQNDNMFKQLTGGSGSFEQVRKVLQGLIDSNDLDHIELSRRDDGKIDMKLVGNKERERKINRTVPNFELKAFELAETLSATLSEEADSIKVENIEGIKLSVNSPLGLAKLAPRTITFMNSDENKPTLKLELAHEEDMNKIVLSVNMTLEEIRAQMNGDKQKEEEK
jgi:hypothetical protein